MVVPLISGCTTAAQIFGYLSVVELPVPFTGWFRQLHCRHWRLYHPYPDFS
ncbi:hypothetical protein GW17_00045189, partial [Ensete ventricosum]